MRLNTKPESVFTHEGGKAKHISPIQELRRSVLACLLWEDSFYESGESIADRIKALVAKCDPKEVADLAIQARGEFKLRHAPLLLARELARHPKSKGRLIGDTIATVIQRADEPAEFLAMYWSEGKAPLAKQVKIGLARAMQKFNAYHLAKYNRDGKVRLRDVIFMSHAKPKDKAQEATWKQLIEGTLPAPDTWEVALSGGANKRETFTRLLKDGRLGYLALLRNLRNMQDAGVDEDLVKLALLSGAEKSKALPFRFVAAAKAAPKFEPELDQAMLATLAQAPKLAGKSIVVIDVSGSMYASPVSRKSDMTRAHAACAIGAIMREVCENPVIYATAGNDRDRIHDTKIVPPRRGMALVDAIYAMREPLGGGGIFLKQVMDFLAEKEKSADRVVVITDEQDCGVGRGDSANLARIIGKTNYVINVASYKNGIGYGSWTHVDGFSEAVITYIQALERESEA